MGLEPRVSCGNGRGRKYGSDSSAIVLRGAPAGKASDTGEKGARKASASHVFLQMCAAGG